MSQNYHTKNCPVCNSKYLWRSLTLHIINKAKAEARNSMYNLLDLAKNKPYSFSPVVLLRQMPHVAYIRKNLKTKKFFRA